jgi:uncharacterized damage-inducible protein DinB
MESLAIRLPISSYFIKFGFDFLFIFKFILMKNLLLIYLMIFTINIDMSAQENKSATQDDPPYYQIPDYPESYTAENVAARVIDGLGFRYYWATEGLTQKDLDYSPGNDGRSISETIDHILGLSYTIVNASLNKPNVFPRDEQPVTFEDKRKKTLENIYQASKVLKESKKGTIDDLKVIFKNNENTNEYPYWNMLNGPIADAIYHTGQVVSHRRSSGNPIDPKVRQFTGKKTE